MATYPKQTNKQRGVWNNNKNKKQPEERLNIDHYNGCRSICNIIKIESRVYWIHRKSIVIVLHLFCMYEIKAICTHTFTAFLVPFNSKTRCWPCLQLQMQYIPCVYDQFMDSKSVPKTKGNYLCVKKQLHMTHIRFFMYIYTCSVFFYL